jgi:hypothetical protein
MGKDWGRLMFVYTHFFVDVCVNKNNLPQEKREGSRTIDGRPWLLCDVLAAV